MHLSSRDITFSAISVALLSVSAWISIPIGPVPFTLQTMAFVFVFCTMPHKQVLLTATTYLLIGTFGVPVFSGMRGGIGLIAGPTGGFLLGFFLASFLAVFIRHTLSQNRAASILICAITILMSYILGFFWLIVTTGINPSFAFASTIAPFIIPDIGKCAAGLILSSAVRKAIPTSLSIR